MAVRTVLLWGPVVLTMAAIAFVSHQPNLRPPLGTSDWMWHISEYGLLALLLVRALAGTVGMGMGAAAMVMIISVSYGISDEFHQSFVPGRTASAKDVLADAAGAGLVVAAALGFRYRQASGAVPEPRQIEITLFGRTGCHPCAEAEAVVSSLARDYPIRLEKVDIDADPDLLRLYGKSIPVVFINGRKWGKLRIDSARLKRKLDSMMRETEDD